MRCSILGKSGKGKTWFSGWLLEQMAPDFRAAIHLDMQNDERGLSHPEDPLLHTVPVDKDLIKKIDWVKLIEKVRYIRIVPEGLNDEEIRELGNHLCDIAYNLGQHYREKEYQKQGILLSIDEAHRVFPQGGGDLDERASNMATGGRKFGVEWIVSTQRPANIHEDMLSQANYGVYFGLTSDRDIAKVDKSCGFNADDLKQFKKFECLIEDDDRGTTNIIDTRDLTRKRPHISKDDGVGDEVMGDLLT